MVDTTVTDADVRDSKRGAERRQAICHAVFELLGKVGYDRMTMDAVATHAKASKATIYRMWPDKPQLVAESLTCEFGDSAESVPNTGSLRGDLLSLLEFACEVTDSEAGEVVAGVITAATHDPRLAKVINDTLFKAKHAMHVQIVQQAVARGEVHPDTDPVVLHEVMHYMLSGRKLWNLGPLDAEFARHVVDDVLIPVLTYRKPLV